MKSLCDDATASDLLSICHVSSWLGHRFEETPLGAKTTRGAKGDQGRRESEKDQTCTKGLGKQRGPEGVKGNKEIGRTQGLGEAERTGGR